MIRLTPFVAVTALAALLAPAAAHAQSCAEIANMVSVGVTADIVVATMKSSGKKYTSEDVDCLQAKGMPATVIAQARATLGAASAAPRPAPGEAPAPAPSSSFDQEETLGGGTFDVGTSPDTDPTADLEEEPAGGPPEIEEAIEAQRAKRYQASTQALYEMLRDNKYPDHETKILHHLAKGLFDMGLYHSSQHYFMEVVKKGPSNPYFKYALPRLVQISKVTGNDYELMRVVHRIPPEAFPRSARNELHYLMGRKLFDKEELSSAAEHFAQVSTKSDLYMRAKFYEGIINQQRGKLKSAVMAFREVVQAEPPSVADAQSGQDLEDMKDLAFINIGRIYYGLQRFDNADTFYGLVERDSHYWAESLFERAWGGFLQSRLNETLGLLLTVRSPYFIESDFIPELTYLEALTFFSLCEYNEVERILEGFDQQYEPMQAEIDNFVTQYASQKDLYDQAFDVYFTNDHDSSVLPQSAFARVLRNRELASMVDHLDLMNAETEAIGVTPAAWRDTLGAELLKGIEEDRVQYKKKAGAELLREMIRLNDMLKSLLVQSEIVSFEVTDAQRADYEFKASNLDDLEAGTRQSIDFATSPDIIYWPFNGEFWRDELGYYQYAEHGNCK